MKTVRRLIYAEIVYAVAFVALGFLALFFFFDLVDELPAIGRDGPQGYQLTHALLYVALLVPSHLYELLPIAVLIGCVFVMARLAQSSEFTILRTSGLGPWLALMTLLKLGLVFTALTFVIGDYLAPPADRAAQLLKARFKGEITIGQTGAWLKERRGASSASVNVRAILPDGSMSGVRIFEFSPDGYFLAQIEADKARFGPGEWILQDARRAEFGSGAADRVSVTRSTVAQYRWPTELTSDMVSAAVLNPSRMRLVDLFVYMRHLEANKQTAQRYQIEFWRKVFYPLSCLVMVVLALPFAYLHFRSGNITSAVFGGVVIGISFFLLNNVFGYIGNLNGWVPWIAAAIPSVIYTFISLGAFVWLVLKR